MEEYFKAKVENIIEVITSLEEVHTDGRTIDMLDRVTDNMSMINCKNDTDFQYMFLYILKRILKVEYTITKQLFEIEYAVSHLAIINPLNDIVELLQETFMYRGLLLYTISVLKNSRYK